MTELSKREYDLEERTAKFAESIIALASKIIKNAITLPLISQIVRAGTSVGANYCEANGASSKKDFKNKIYICKKEIQETKYWLRIIANADKNVSEESRKIWKEAQELTLIFAKIISTMEKKQ
ncbi:four helix bundle protein [Candidatus Giovannonibacteria bacterium]|nr:four helix bundle protein [Candidatus Giovannonibacteria bacterium]